MYCSYIKSPLKFVKKKLGERCSLLPSKLNYLVLFGFTSFNYFSIPKKNHEENKNYGLLRNLQVWLDPIWKYSM